MVLFILIGLGIGTLLNIAQEAVRPAPTRAVYARSGDLVALAASEPTDVGTRFSFATTLGRVAPNAVLMVPEGIPIDKRQLSGLAGIRVEREEYEPYVDEVQLLQVDDIAVRSGVGRLRFEDDPKEFVVIWVEDNEPPQTMWLIPGVDRILVIDDRALSMMPDA